MSTPTRNRRNQPASPADRPIRPLPGPLRAALVPVAACAAALVLLTAYTATGSAGEAPARISVSDARVFRPTNAEATAALFTIRNSGGTADLLLSLDSPLLGDAMLARTVVRDGGGRMTPAGPVAVPARGAVTMDPAGLDAMILRPPQLRLGQRVPFVLRFRDSGEIRVEAVVVRPGA
ncbi:copper chaperone PCu(A)C [Streptomyces sp. H10-C2]|uniref:copper chaperone PCu(A)C n=1 Tax=Streptomyces sp. H10-C2 TaxID=3046210 RepID=UPI0024B8CB9E|nr:copper chaperone PCu(A)C [Streptomyces sp. H10-C2]MDJ0369866.1 copper chaperone PCu(A)C [Streptomyces sp. H10-C2]